MPGASQGDAPGVLQSRPTPRAFGLATLSWSAAPGDEPDARLVE
ncbi:hypothetical protein [Cellulomonas wangleii]|nr:hypothetical protein [Cellulomonas wangleii]